MKAAEWVYAFNGNVDATFHGLGFASEQKLSGLKLGLGVSCESCCFDALVSFYVLGVNGQLSAFHGYSG
jgi:hypothetical protein